MKYDFGDIIKQADSDPDQLGELMDHPAFDWYIHISNHVPDTLEVDLVNIKVLDTGEFLYQSIPIRNPNFMGYILNRMMVVRAIAGHASDKVFHYSKEFTLCTDDGDEYDLAIRCIFTKMEEQFTIELVVAESKFTLQTTLVFSNDTTSVDDFLMVFVGIFNRIQYDTYMGTISDEKPLDAIANEIQRVVEKLVLEHPLTQ